MDDRRVSNVELFFDLVFVFTITQLTSNVWWMYDGYAWLTNAVDAAPGRAAPVAVDSRVRLRLPSVLGGIVALAVGVKQTIAGPAYLGGATAWLNAGGLATYLAGLALFRAVLGIWRPRVPLIVAALSLGTLPIGIVASPEGAARGHGSDPGRRRPLRNDRT